MLLGAHPAAVFDVMRVEFCDFVVISVILGTNYEVRVHYVLVCFWTDRVCLTVTYFGVNAQLEIL